MKGWRYRWVDEWMDGRMEVGMNGGIIDELLCEIREGRMSEERIEAKEQVRKGSN
jgi:hypothetical protein